LVVAPWLQVDRLLLILNLQSGMFSIISIGYKFVAPEHIATVQPTSVAAPIQTEHFDNEIRGCDDHPNDDENNAVEDDP
nr:hypothetical protein [Tanacetum cinerariifolium]